MNTDWSQIAQVIGYGFTAVFVVLAALMLVLHASSAIINRLLPGQAVPNKNN